MGLWTNMYSKKNDAYAYNVLISLLLSFFIKEQIISVVNDL